MQALFELLKPADKVEYLVDTCFFVHVFESGRQGDFIDFCRRSVVGISSFNIAELLNMHHKLNGPQNHHIRNFLKEGVLFRVDIGVVPGDVKAERSYVLAFDEDLIRIIRDPSDAVLLVLGLKIRASILTRDKHHLFTTKAENYIKDCTISILNEIPR